MGRHGWGDFDISRGRISHNPSWSLDPVVTKIFFFLYHCLSQVIYPVVLLTGAALHIHSSALVSVEWLVKNVTYRPHCYICFTWDNSVRFLFSARQPFPRWDCFYWQLLETLRAKIGDPTGFDNRLSKRSPSLTQVKL